MMRLILATGLILGLGALVAYQFYAQPPQVAVETSAKPILIAGIDEPAEMRVPPFPKSNVSEPMRMEAEALKNVDLKTDPSAMVGPLNSILAKYPDWWDGYAGRAAFLCVRGDRAAALADIETAVKHIGTIQSLQVADLLSMRAWLKHADGDDVSALADLDTAIKSDLDEPTKFVNSGATAPEKTKSTPCVWTETDMDVIVNHFPSDARAYMARGLYFSFFTIFNHDTLQRARADFDSAIKLDATSALPHLFAADVLEKAFPFRGIGMSDAEKSNLNTSRLNELSMAISLDPHLIPALEHRASLYLSLKQYAQAIADFDRVTALDPSNVLALNDRGVAKSETGDFYGAISDFTNAIAHKERELQNTTSYEDRANAYIKTQQWALAIDDLTTAISLQTGAMVLLSNVKQFRALYPEYAAASDEAIAHKLNQTFYPDMKYEDFSKQFLQTNGPWESTIIPDLYLKRLDVYLMEGDWHRAAVEWQRVANGFPSYASVIDRWHEVGSSSDGDHVFLDMKTFDDSRRDSVKFWIKKAQGTDDTSGPTSIDQFELNCGTRQLRHLSSSNYDASGNVIFTDDKGGAWTSITPDTLGELYFNGSCGNHT